MLTPDEHKATIQERNEYREEYRRELERHVEPIKTAARETDKSALELAQSGIKTMTLLNGSALIAIPAVVTLFGVDAKAVIQRLFIAGGFYVFGMITAVLSSVLGALALSHRSDRDYNLGEATQQTCSPWERDWSNTALDPGSTVTNSGVVVVPKDTKP
jgi:hypothetical protein